MGETERDMHNMNAGTGGRGGEGMNAGACMIQKGGQACKDRLRNKKKKKRMNGKRVTEHVDMVRQREKICYSPESEMLLLPAASHAADAGCAVMSQTSGRDGRTRR